MYNNSQLPELMQQRYQALPLSIIELFQYGTVEVVLEKTVSQFTLSEEQKSGLQMEIDLILYLFLTRKGLIERLTESLPTEISIAREISLFLDEELFSIVDGELKIAAELLEDETSKEIKPTITEGTENTSPKITPEVKETIQNAVKPIRTFAEDVEISRAHSYGTFKSQTSEEEGVYRSSQDDIIKK